MASIGLTTTFYWLPVATVFRSAGSLRAGASEFTYFHLHVFTSRRASPGKPFPRYPAYSDAAAPYSLSSLVIHQDPPFFFPSSPLELYPRPNRLLRGLTGARQYKFPFIPVAGADDTAALPHRLTSPQMPIYCTWQPLWSRRTSGVEYAR